MMPYADYDPAQILSGLNKRKKTDKIWLKSLPIGGDAPIAVQSMTDVPTEEVDRVIHQIQRLKDAGADTVRISVNHGKAASAFELICRAFPDYPLIADIHFDARLALRAIEAGAAGLRINPGNIGDFSRVKAVVEAARSREVALRIGVNLGSIPLEYRAGSEQDPVAALVGAALVHCEYFQKLHFEAYKISVKASDPQVAIQAYRQLSRLTSKPLHLGVTEAGGRRAGTVKSSVALGILLSEGIGDTLRISLSCDPVEEVKVGFELLKALKLRSKGLNIIACPTCARKEFDVSGIVELLENEFSQLNQHLDIAVMGCCVNGPGECRMADIGICGGPQESVLYEQGKPTGERVHNSSIARALREKILTRLASTQKKNDQEALD